MTHPDAEPGPEPVEAPLEVAPPPVTANVRAFRILVRNELFRRVELVAMRRWSELGELDGGDGWDTDRWFAALEPYFAEHATVGIDADARSLAYVQMEEAGRRWSVRQTLSDPAGDHDWAISAEVDLDASDEAGVAVVAVRGVGPI